ncbi:MAG TPA: NAD-dependent succinate-semialdehyde dehydrogenase [Ktedonobacteraceae bacterium]|jgi:succinate-semialdehyde dehydrogenase/glutarate-semialdehyde dehydrogenase
MSIQSINPATEEVLETFELYTKEQIDQALEQTNRAWKEWRDTTFGQRAELLHQVAQYLRTHKAKYARMATLEMGKTIVEAEAEIEKCAWACDYFAENGERFLENETVKSSATESYVAFTPLGTVLALMPWNFPFWQVFRFAAPALMAGNTIILKHASNVSRTSLEMEHIFEECSFPKGIFRSVLVRGSETGSLIEDPRIAAVTLTGSEAAGVEVASTSGHALKKHVLELGGADAFIVLADADLDTAAQVAVRARFQNNGQSCIAAKRFIVVDEVAKAFEQKFVEAATKLHMGNPLERETTLGPVARADLRDTLDRQVQESVKMGASVLLGGKLHDGKGYFYPATIVTNVTPEMPMFKEETFGPAAAVIHAHDTDHAIELANSSQYGLGGNLWTRDIEKARQIASHLASGAVFINGMTTSDPRLPFGGIKHSGYGRELSSFGIREFVNIQTVWIGPAVS